MWRCQNCSEMHEDAFDACWNCGTLAEGTSAPDFHPEPHDPVPTKHSNDPAKSVAARLRWLRRVPRLVIALALVLPLVGLSWYFQLPYSVERFVLPLLFSIAIFIPGAIQRRSRRQLLIMIVLGATALGLREAIWAAPVPDWSMLYFLGPAVTMILLGMAEWYFTSDAGEVREVWVVLACLGAAALYTTIQFPMNALPWDIPCPVDYGWGTVRVSYFTSWPLQTLLVWLAIPVGLAAGKRSASVLKPVFATGVTVVLAVYVAFWTWGIYELAEWSLAGKGPFSRSEGAYLLARRGSESDYEFIWQQFRDREPDESLTSDNWRWTCLRILREHDSDKCDDRLVQLLFERPGEDYAAMAAPVIAEHKRYDAVPILMRYAILGDTSCTEALEEMRIPQVAMALVCRAELEWQWKEPVLGMGPKGVVIERDLRERFVQVMGVDAGDQLDSWIELYEESISRLPTPLSPSQQQEVNTVVDSRIRWREAVGRWQEVCEHLWYEHARQAMIDRGRDMELEAVDEFHLQLGSGKITGFPAEGDDLYPAFTDFHQFYNEAKRLFRIRGPDWTVPTTDALKKEVDAYVERVEAECKKHEVPDKPRSDGPLL